MSDIRLWKLNALDPERRLAVRRLLPLGRDRALVLLTRHADGVADGEDR